VCVQLPHASHQRNRVREQLPLSTYCKDTKRTAATSTPIALVVVLFGCTVEVALGRGYAWPEMNCSFPGRSWARYFSQITVQGIDSVWKLNFEMPVFAPGLCSPHQYRIQFFIKFSTPKKHRHILTRSVERPNFTNLYTNRKESTTLKLLKVFVSCQRLFVTLHRCCVIWRRRIIMRDFRIIYIRC
jgi:hypothetical protein